MYTQIRAYMHACMCMLKKENKRELSILNIDWCELHIVASPQLPRSTNGLDDCDGWCSWILFALLMAASYHHDDFMMIFTIIEMWRW